MERKELQEIINKLESSNSKDEALFGIINPGADPEDSIIEANTQGLELFAAELLKASRDKEYLKIRRNGSFQTLPHTEEWIQGDFIPCEIHLVQNNRDPSKFQPYVETWSDKILKGGCLIVLAFIILAAVIGTIWIFKYLFL